MIDKSLALIFSLRHLAKVQERKRQGGGVNQVPVGGAGLFFVNVSQHLDVLSVCCGPALNSGGSANQGPQLNVSQESLRLGENEQRRWPAYIRLIGGSPGPTVVMTEWDLLLRFRPQWQCVVSDMVVKIDQQRQYPCILHVHHGSC